MKFHCVPQLVRLRHRLAHEMKWYKFVHKVLCCIFLFHEAHKFRASECMLYEKAIVNVIFIVVASVADAAAAAFVASGHCRSIFAQCAFRFREFIVVECVFFLFFSTFRNNSCIVRLTAVRIARVQHQFHKIQIEKFSCFFFGTIHSSWSYIACACCIAIETT